MALSVHALCKRYHTGATVLSNVGFEVPDGELVVLVGPSGSGKTTLLHCIVGLLTPDQGKITIDGICVTHKRPHLRGVGIMMQDQPLYEHLSVEANIGFPLKARGVKRADTACRVANTLEALELSEIATRRVSQLSGGERRRVALGRAIIVKPRVLLLDEPFVSLDQQLQDAMKMLIQQVHDDTKASTLLVTHHRDDMNAFGDRVIDMRSL